MTEDHGLIGALPALASPDAGDAERAQAVVARFVARFGAPPLEEYRRVYTSMGVPWPGEDEVRRLHPVADTAASAA